MRTVGDEAGDGEVTAIQPVAITLHGAFDGAGDGCPAVHALWIGERNVSGRRHIRRARCAPLVIEQCRNVETIEDHQDVDVAVGRVVSPSDRAVKPHLDRIELSDEVDDEKLAPIRQIVSVPERAAIIEAV